MHLMDNPHFEVMRHDVTFPLYVEVDEIYNLACPASPIHYQFDPVQTTKTSVHGAINMLGSGQAGEGAASSRHPPARCMATRGASAARRLLGHVNPIGPRACYDEGKRCAETLFFDYHRQHKVGIKVARIFNTYGPRMHPNDGRVVSNFIDAGAAGETDHHLRRRRADPLLLLRRRPGRGIDPADGYAGRCDRPDQYRQPHRAPILELAEMVIELTGSKSKIVFEPPSVDDPRQRRPDVEQARRLLDWSPSTPVHEGLGRTIAYFEAQLARGDYDSATVRQWRPQAHCLIT